MILHRFSKSARAFNTREAGSISAMNLYFLVAVGILAGVAIDVSNLMSARTHLQTVSDTAAHVALVEREWSDADDARATAVAVASGLNRSVARIVPTRPKVAIPSDSHWLMPVRERLENWTISTSNMA